MLEDDYNDVLGKAMRGHGLDSRSLADAISSDEGAVRKLLDGAFDEGLVRQCAKVLELDTEKLAAHPNYSPQVDLPQGLEVITTPFGHLGVNSFLVSSGEHRLLFDTGTNPQPSLERSPTEVFVTHEHPDHISGINMFEHAHMPMAFAPHQLLTRDTLHITVLDVAGHCIPARAFYIQGLTQPVCIVGDSIFAGSIGGCASPSVYQLALDNIRSEILTLPENTILCPGHGPCTTVALEKANNPFL